MNKELPHTYIQDVVQTAYYTDYTNKCICERKRGHPIHQKKFRKLPRTDAELNELLKMVMRSRA